jgi:peptidoglycan/LPS O-acetylase OafA/YrhL
MPFVFSLGVMFPPYVTAVAAVFIVSPLILRSALALGEAKWATGLGMLSYPLYAVHFPILAATKAAGANALAGGFVALICAIYVMFIYERKRRGVPLPALGLGLAKRVRRKNL